MSWHRIGVISDTHGMLRPQARKVLATVELILHGGDIVSPDLLEKLEKLGQTAKVIAVRGNGDRDWVEPLPEEVLLDLYGKKIYMIHNRKYLSSRAEAADIILYGHSHKYEETEIDGKLWLNPGSCGPRRFGRPLTMAVLEINPETGEVRVEKIDLDEVGEDVPAPAPVDLRKTVEAVIRDLKKGKSVDAIVKSRRIERGLTEQICQIYFTHPGIDVQGVMDRMEIAGM